MLHPSSMPAFMTSDVRKAVLFPDSCRRSDAAAMYDGPFQRVHLERFAENGVGRQCERGDYGGRCGAGCHPGLSNRKIKENTRIAAGKIRHPAACALQTLELRAVGWLIGRLWWIFVGLRCLVAVTYVDGMEEKRKPVRPAHLKHLQVGYSGVYLCAISQCAGVTLMRVQDAMAAGKLINAGPYTDPVDGGIQIFQGVTKDEVLAILNRDPCACCEGCCLSVAA